MLKSLYKRILIKLDLDTFQLQELSSKLNSDQVCAGDFVEGDKMCPNTLALAIKENVGRFTNSKQAKDLFPKYNIFQFELSVLFYILFDIPAKLSSRLHARLLSSLRESVTELISKKI
jgi:hypothetical protein